MAEINEVLTELNVWWKEEFKVEFREREIYRQIQKFVPLPQIIALTGLRRVGKTTLMYKLIEDAITDGHDPRNIIYFSFDEFRAVQIRQVLRAYGNMSSVTIFFVLDQIIRQGDPRPGDYALLQGFGPGLTIELCLLQW